MEILTKRETLVLTVTVVVFLSLLFPALMHARREARDGIRRNEIAAFKQLLEQYNNEYEIYPLEFDARPHEYVVLEKTDKGAITWYLQAELENEHAVLADYDAEEGRNYYYRYILRDGKSFYEVCGGEPLCGV